MPKPNQIKTKIIRAPICFDRQVSYMCKIYGYKHKTEFLAKEGTIIFQNVDFINKMFMPFTKKKGRNK